MAINWRRGGMFAGGLLLGVLGAAALFNAGGGDDGPEGGSAASGPQATVMGATAAPQVQCSFGQIVPAASREDGLLPLDKDLQGRSASAVTTLLTTGKEAAASGKQRDAETAFLMACRSAETLKNDPIPLADSHYQLGRHYAQVASNPNAANRGELLKRSQALYGSALQAYTTHRGPDHEKTRFAREGLESLQKVAGGSLPAAPAAPAVAVAPAPAPAPASVPAPAPQIAAAPAPAPLPAPVTAPAAKSESERAAESARASGAARAPEPARAPETARAPAPAPTVTARAPETTRAPQPAPAPTVTARAQPEPVRTPEPPRAAARPEPAPQPAESRPRSPEPTAPQVAAVTPPPQPTRPRAKPSFDCAKARSTTEKLICADEDLARQDRELGRLHARAKQAAPDRRAFQRESDAEWARRESTCTDADCLRRWYAQRRDELSAAASRPAPAPAPRTGRTERSPEPATTRTDTTTERTPAAPVARAPVVRVEPEPPRVIRVEPEAPRVVRVQPPADPAPSSAGAAPTASGSIGQATGDVGTPD